MAFKNATTTANQAQPGSHPATLLPLSQRIFPLVIGLWLAVVFAKFGNPIIFSDLIDSPRNFTELGLNSWPTSWGYLLVGIVVLSSLPIARWKPAAPKWVLLLPLVWFGWQCISALQTVNAKLTQETLLNFTACIVCFYVGLFALSRVQNLWPVWCGLLLGLLFSLWLGLDQHFGGIEQTRRYVQSINWDLYPPELKAKLTSPEFQQKIASNRIWGSFIYPNALAGGILLALPVSLAALWTVSLKFSFIVRGILIGTVAYLGLAGLFWSGSKAGWLIMLGMGLAAFLHLQQIGKRMKLFGLFALLALGLAGFYGKYSAYFARKNNSAVARMDYWRAGWHLLQERPLLGSGPGTFMVGYKRLKRPESEPTKLTHNDYLQQGSDSGIVGLCTYLFWVIGSVTVLYPRIRKKPPLAFAVWLGLSGMALQEFVEFSLYIPALAWPFFLLLGWLWGSGTIVTNDA